MKKINSDTISYNIIDIYKYHISIRYNLSLGYVGIPFRSIITCLGGTENHNKITRKLRKPRESKLTINKKIEKKLSLLFRTILTVY